MLEGTRFGEVRSEERTSICGDARSDRAGAGSIKKRDILSENGLEVLLADPPRHSLAILYPLSLLHTNER